MGTWKAWIHAARLRTLPLALASVTMGGILAYIDGHVNQTVLILSVLTTILLQVLSNFANDYGDFFSGVDLEGRVGPVRAMQGGHITPNQMKWAIIVTSVFAFLSGLALLWIAEISQMARVVLFCIGVLAILAAITYTIGNRPYGYLGLGDVAVFLFFGFTGVLGSHYLIHGEFVFRNFYMAGAIGLFSVGVLNLNNIRDMEADKLHKKNTIAVWLGKRNARWYHTILIGLAWILVFLYTNSQDENRLAFLIFLTLPLFLLNIWLLWRRDHHRIDPLLRQLALSTLFFVLFFGILWVFL